MKKFFIGIFALLAIVLACSCDPTAQTQNTKTDTVEVVTVQTDTLMMNMDTIHCIAVTKNGEQCKNHKVKGDSLCSVHRKK